MLQDSGGLYVPSSLTGWVTSLWWERSYSPATGVLKQTLHPRVPLTARFIPAIGQPLTGRGVTRGRPPRGTPACAHAQNWHHDHRDRRTGYQA